MLFGRFLVNSTLSISAFPHILQETKFLFLWFLVLSFYKKIIVVKLNYVSCESQVLKVLFVQWNNLVA